MRSRPKSSNWSPIKAGLGFVCASMMLASSAALPSTANAAPARYVYEVCDPALPGGGTPGVRFVANPGAPIGAGNTCAHPGGTLGIAQWGHIGASTASAGFWDIPVASPPGGGVESVTISAQACGAGPGSVIFVFEQGWPPNCRGETQRIFRTNPKAFHGFWIWLGCNGNYAPGCDAGPNVSVRYIAAVEVDPVAPKLSALQGSLLAGGVLRGRQSLAIDASDEGGGLSNVSVSVNGLPAAQPSAPNCSLVQTTNPSVLGIVAENPPLLGTVAVAVTPCPTKLKPSWTLNTAAYPFHDGANSVQVCASDFATLNEPNTTCSPTQTVNVDNSCNESPIAGGEVLSARFASSRNEEITVPFARPATVTGELHSDAGDAISGATICVQMQTEGSEGGAVPIATTTTDARGHFSYKVPPGPNRRVSIGYRHDTFQVARWLHYYAHTKPTIRLTPGRVQSGDQVRITGRVPGPSAAGRVAVLQAAGLRSKRWYTFHRATSNQRGIFHSRYRFDATTQTTTYRIRAVIPKQADYPWEQGHSQPALVQVRVGR